MNYAEILKSLKESSPFDLFRLRTAITNELEKPELISSIRKHLAAEMVITFFCEEKNRLVDAVIQKFTAKYVYAINKEDGLRWQIEYSSINIGNVSTNINPDSSKALSKNNLTVGETVGFNHEDVEIYGRIIRLNPKSVSLRTAENKKWRVGYSHLYKVIQGSACEINNTFIEGEVIVE